MTTTETADTPKQQQTSPTKTSALKGLWLWFNERYGLKNIIGFTLLYYVCASTGRAEQDLSLFQWVDILNLIAVNAYFLMLRVLDEHKDYEIDCLHHQERVLQRGLTNLGQLKIVGGLCLVIQIAWNYQLDPQFSQLSWLWLTAIAYTTLMTKEFFCKEWLEQRLWLYGLSHMLVMVPVTLWICQLTNPNYDLALTVPLVATATLVFFGGALAEVSRKVRAPEEEREGVDSYTKNLGIKTTMGVLVFIAFMLAFPVASLLLTVTYSLLLLASILPPFMTFLLVVKAATNFAKTPSAQATKKVEGNALLHLLVSYIGFMVTLSLA